MHTDNPNLENGGDAEVGGPRVQGQPGIRGETLSSEIKQQHWKRRGSRGEGRERTVLLNDNCLKTVCVSPDGGHPVGGMFWRG